MRLTWNRQRHFYGEPDDVQLEISGAQLGQILAWLSITRPGFLGKTDAKTGAPAELWPRDHVAAELEGLSGLARALAMSDRDNLVEEGDGALTTLSNQLADLAGQLWALEKAPEHLKKATVTIGAPAAEAK